jgi:putative MATE family efflux protein
MKNKAMINKLNFIDSYYNKLNKFGKLFWEALSGTEQDYTSGSIRKAIFLLAIPMIFETIWESFFAIADIYFVSSLGSEAIATVGITESLMSIIYAIAMGLSMSAAAMVSRRIGEKEHAKASRVAAQAILLGLFASFIIAIPGYFYSSEIMQLMGAEAKIIDELSVYTSIMLLGNGVIIMLFIINAIFRSAGSPSISMIVLMIANILNIILDPILIFGWGPIPAMGISGAAIATNTGRGIAVLIQFYLLFSSKSNIQLKMKDFIPDFGRLFKLFKLSLGGIGQLLIATTSWVGLVRIIAEFGSDAVAGYTIGIRILIFALMPFWGLANAAATLVGQNLGAKKSMRAEQSVWFAVKYSFGIAILVGIAFALIPEYWVNLLTQDSSVIPYAAECLRTIAFGFVFYCIGMVFISSINGAGDTTTPTLINLFCFWLFEIPLAYVLAVGFDFQESGVFWSIVIAETLITCVALIIFKRGKWKLREV